MRNSCLKFLLCILIEFMYLLIHNATHEQYIAHVIPQRVITEITTTQLQNTLTLTHSQTGDNDQEKYRSSIYFVYIFNCWSY